MATKTETEAAVAYPKRHKFTVEEVERIAEAGGFDEDARMELIGGEFVDMAPIGFRHEMCVAQLTRLLNRTVGDAALVWPQNNSIRLSGVSLPEPDLTLLSWRDYDTSKRPAASDVLLIVEVAETSLKYDRGVKGPLYAEAGIPEYWIVNLQENVIEVYSDPAEGSYRQTRHARAGETLPLPGGLQGALDVKAVLVGPSAP